LSSGSPNWKNEVDKLDQMRGFPRHSQVDEGEDKPGGQKYSGGVAELARVSSIGLFNTEGRMKEGSVGHPETAVRTEN